MTPDTLLTRARRVITALGLALPLGLGGLSIATTAFAGNAVTVEKITVHGASLEGNLEGNSADRSVTVFLPPDYADHPDKRYPVIYGLHGYTINNEIWSNEIKAEQGLQAALAGGVPGVIVVLPSTQTLHNGSMYSASVTTGDWDSFITRDLVAYIDSHYRTIADRRSRGLVGHSMGGYGASRIGMKHPEVYGALYIMSPCCMSARGAPPPEVSAQLEAVTSADETRTMGFLQRATLAVASAWSPNPKNPPLYVDLPTKGGVEQPDVLNRWAANAPLDMVYQYIFNLRQYKAISIDVGDRDGLKVDAAEFHRILSDNGIENSFEIYDGDHVSGVADRFQTHVLPFFAKHLDFAPQP